MKLFPGRHKPNFQLTKRIGAAALMLILILALLVGTFAASLGRSAADERRSERQHQKVAILNSAIDAVSAFGMQIDSPIRLPLDQSGQRWVIVESIATRASDAQKEETRQFEATLYHNDLPGLSIRRQSGSDP